MGVPLFIIHFSRIFHEKKHPAIGDSAFMESSKLWMLLNKSCKNGKMKVYQRSPRLAEILTNISSIPRRDDVSSIYFYTIKHSISISFYAFHDIAKYHLPKNGLLLPSERSAQRLCHPGWPRTILFSPGAPWHGPVSQLESGRICVPEH